MNIKKSGLKTTAVLFLASAALLLSTGIVYAEGSCQIIRIEQEKGVGGSRIDIYPAKVTIPVGTCTVWINWVEFKEVQVSFREDAKVCMLSTVTPVGFEELKLKDNESCYISESLPRGKTASLNWAKPGIFKYVLEAPGSRGTATTGFSGNILAKGVIEVIAPEKAEVAFPLDSDGDGVPDSEDLCPDTPIGATVNNKGCWALKGVMLFDFDSSTIKPEAYSLLDEVAIILEHNPEIKGEIRGYTDSTGTEEYNQQLSEKRAQAVEEYLEKKGTDPARLTSKGYGASQPIASNETKEGRQENRRVELKRTK